MEKSKAQQLGNVDEIDDETGRFDSAYLADLLDANTPVAPPAPLTPTDAEIIDYIGLCVAMMLHRQGHDRVQEPDQRHVLAVADHITRQVRPDHLAYLYTLSTHNCLPAPTGEPDDDDQ